MIEGARWKRADSAAARSSLRPAPRSPGGRETKRRRLRPQRAGKGESGGGPCTGSGSAGRGDGRLPAPIRCAPDEGALRPDTGTAHSLAAVGGRGAAASGTRGRDDWGSGLRGRVQRPVSLLAVVPGGVWDLAVPVPERRRHGVGELPSSGLAPPRGTHFFPIPRFPAPVSAPVSPV